MIKSLALITALASGCAALHTDQFQSDVWTFDHENTVDPSARAKFVVALKLNNVDSMRKEFLEVSDPKSSSYGQHLTAAQLNAKYGPSAEEKEKVISHFEKIPGAEVSVGPHGDMLHVSATAGAIEEALQTKLGFVKHSRQMTDKQSLRAKESLVVPDEIGDLISFISLNSPVNHVMPRGAKALKQKQAIETAAMTEEQAKASVGITAGNEEALIRFTPYCYGNVLNTFSPPCSSSPLDQTPTFTFSVTTHANNKTDSYLLDTDPTNFVVKNTGVYCYNTYTVQTCGGNDGKNCTCLTKISPLPKYTQLRVNITSTSPAQPETLVVGTSNLFALTDVATAHFLSELYNVPQGISVQHGSNQSVAEFYGEFYSNSDLATFLALSGLPTASIPEENVYGDLANDQDEPGGEAQLDVEYIMALAPGAETFFYSMGDYNPNDPVNTTINEGFLDYLLLVQSQPYPPLVHSLSYGDVEAEIFNTSQNGTVQYGTRCDQEFMKMGLRGLTVVFSSGDDGIGNSIIRTDKETACSQAWPSWPASSPYVTAVGATQLTNKYLPVCGMPYSLPYPGIPQSQNLLAECTGTGETVCTGSFGGVITSGGGFSDVNNRTETAPWQEAAVSKYLEASNSAAYPPLSYFNADGRGYPDVSTYGSNYMIYLDGKLTRESGTSASAPVFAAMVTLWNDMRLAYGQPPMGFIAPFLYQAAAIAPDAFNDIVTGNNACGVGSSIETAPCCEYSFAATPGWDASTGLGSPNFQVLSNLVINPDSEFPSVSAFPTGVASVDTYTTESADDDVTTQALSGVVLGAVGVAVGLVSLVLTLCYGGVAKKQNTLIGNGDRSAAINHTKYEQLSALDLLGSSTHPLSTQNTANSTDSDDKKCLVSNGSTAIISTATDEKEVEISFNVLRTTAD